MQVKEMIEKIVQGDVILMSTNCVRKELKFLGATCNRALSFANRQCDTANCHDRPVIAPPSKCISTIIGATNPGGGRFFARPLLRPAASSCARWTRACSTGIREV